jgi:hypothetical protein
MEQGQTQGLHGSATFMGRLRPTVGEPGGFTDRLGLLRLGSRIEGRIVLDPIGIVAPTQAAKAIPYVRAVFNYADLHLVKAEYGFVWLTYWEPTTSDLPPLEFNFFC